VAARGHNALERSRSPQVPLAGILAEMVRSALEWEADSQLDPEPESSFNQDATGIDCPPTNPVPVS
jgi:hypothetical protein